MLKTTASAAVPVYAQVWHVGALHRLEVRRDVIVELRGRAFAPRVTQASRYNTTREQTQANVKKQIAAVHFP